MRRGLTRNDAHMAMRRCVAECNSALWGERAAERGGGEGAHHGGVRPEVTCVAGIFPTFNLSCYITVQWLMHFDENSLLYKPFVRQGRRGGIAKHLTTRTVVLQESIRELIASSNRLSF